MLFAAYLLASFAFSIGATIYGAVQGNKSEKLQKARDKYNILADARALLRNVTQTNYDRLAERLHLDRQDVKTRFERFKNEFQIGSRAIDFDHLVNKIDKQLDDGKKELINFDQQTKKELEEAAQGIHNETAIKQASPATQEKNKQLTQDASKNQNLRNQNPTSNPFQPWNY